VVENMVYMRCPESIQWTWKEASGMSIVRTVKPQESIQWNWKAQGYVTRNSGNVTSNESIQWNWKTMITSYD
jgi:hypothetical protein